MVKCKHPIKERQAVTGGFENYLCLVVCVRCGKIIFKRVIKNLEDDEDEEDE